ncbi:ribonuclease H-like domain-containing protein [Rhizophagus irregularis DAOM 181602=DAOM 197198]|nr:ribonuclease H-like domain-containing protein [Rhizophagus irregularis DAOM 181602=DAOM 197198]
MTREKHKLSGYFLMLEEKSNKYNNYAVCQECVRGLDREEAMKQRFTNTKRACAKHLENCPYWAERHSSEETQAIIQKAMDTSTPSQGSSNLNNFFYKSSRANSISSISDISFRSFGPLDNYMYHELKPEQIETFECLLLDVTVACGFAFHWVDNPAVKELFKWLNPMLELPDRKQLSGRILKKASNNLKDIVLNDAINDDLGIMLAFDGWKNVSRQNLLGSVLFTSECNMIIWKVEDISGKRCTSDIIIDETKKSFDELEKKNIKINGLITDSASENVAARKRLRLQYRDKIFLPCFAHQMNLCIGDIFKESSSLSDAAEGAISLITFFSRSKVWLGRLQNEQAAIYKVHIALVTSATTRWNSYYYCFASLLKTKGALRISIKKIETFLISYCATLNKLQRQNSRLHEVLHGFGNVVMTLKTFEDQELATTLLSKIERRWRDWEQPFLLLSFLLHPFYRDTKFNPALNLSFPHLAKWVLYYYCAWFKEEPTVLLAELEEYRSKKYPYTDSISKQFKNNILDYWNFTKGYSKELYRVAQRIFSITVSTASLERLFSTMGWYHSKRRNRLKAEKVLSLAQIRASMQRQQQLYELDYHAKQYQTTITRTSDNIEFARLENDDEIFILSNNEGSDTDSETNEYDNESINNIYTQPLASANEWRKTVMDWIEMIENELQDQDNELASITDTYDISIENIEQIQHPAIDPQAKWELKNIFIENLELPGYLEDFIIGKA